MSLHKVVNGVRVDMTPEEEAEIRAEWAANDAAPKPEPKPTLDDVVAVLRADTSLAAKLDARISAVALDAQIVKE